MAKDPRIPEIDEPKIHMMGFRVSLSDKKLIEDFAAENNYRLSAMMRVAVLSYIRDHKNK